MNTLVGLTPGEVDVYQGYVTQMMSGLHPYRDFWFEYPPGLLPIAAIPQMMISNPDHYFIAWRIFMVATIAFCVYLIPKAKMKGAVVIEETSVVNIPTGSFLGYSSGVFEFLAILLASGLFLFHRFDFFVAAIVLFGVVAYRHGKHSLAMMFMVLGAFTKLYPILFVPILLLYTPAKNWLKSIATMIVTGLPIYLYWKPGLAKFLEFHGDKPIQIESIQGMYHHMAPIVYERFSFVYENTHTDKVFQYGILLMSLAFVTLIRKKITFEIACTIVLTAFLIGGNIFSPQYMLWFASFVPFLPRIYSVNLVGLTWLTTYYFGYYDAIVAKLAPETILLTLRNVWLIGFFIKLLFDRYEDKI